MVIKFIDTHDYIVATIFERLQLEASGFSTVKTNMYTTAGYRSLASVITPRIRTIRGGTYATNSPGGRSSRIPCVHGLRRLVEELLKSGITGFSLFETEYGESQNRELDAITARPCNCLFDVTLKPHNIATIIERVSPNDTLNHKHMNARAFADYYSPERQKKLDDGLKPKEWVDTHGDSKIIVGYRYYNINAWPEAITGGYSKTWSTGEMTAVCTALPGSAMGKPTVSRPTALPIHRLMYGDHLLGSQQDQDINSEPNTHELQQQILCQTHLKNQHICQCGIHAFYTPQRARAIYARADSFLLTQVTLFGQVVSDQYGYRASHARIEAMWLMKDTQTHGPIDTFDDWVAFAFSNKYGSPCKVADLQEWKEFVKPLTPPIHPGLGVPWAESGYPIQ